MDDLCKSFHCSNDLSCFGDVICVNVFKES